MQDSSLHPLSHFTHCPHCGSAHFVENNFKSKRCEDCGFVYYANACSATVAFIMRPSAEPGGEDELLMARRAKNPAKGTLDLVGGFVDMEETAEEGMLREITEETGLPRDVLPAPQYLFSFPNLYEYSGMTIHTLDMFFLLRLPHDVDPVAHDDVADLQWVPLSQVKPELVGLRSIRNGVIRFLQSNGF